MFTFEKNTDRNLWTCGNTKGGFKRESALLGESLSDYIWLMSNINGNNIDICIQELDFFTDLQVNDWLLVYIIKRFCTNRKKYFIQFPIAFLQSSPWLFLGIVC